MIFLSCRLGESQGCPEPTLHILNCTKQSCVQSCIKYMAKLLMVGASMRGYLLLPRYFNIWNPITEEIPPLSN